MKHGTTRSKAHPTSRVEAFLATSELNNLLELQAGIESRIAQLQATLGIFNGRPALQSMTHQEDEFRGLGTPSLVSPAKKKRTLNAAARRRIAVAQRKRWADHRRNLEQAAKNAPAPVKKARSAPRRTASQKAVQASASLRNPSTELANLDEITL